MSKNKTHTIFSKRTITVNNKTYDSFEELPEEQRELFRSMMDFGVGMTDDGVSETSYQYNGVSYDSFDDMPQEAQDIFLNNNFLFAQTNSNSDRYRNIKEKQVNEIHQQQLNSIKDSKEFYPDTGTKAPSSNKDYYSKSPNQSNEYVPAVQKQNSSYGWVSVVIILMIVTAVTWKTFF
jgi:uncharacterized membrane protein